MGATQDLPAGATQGFLDKPVSQFLLTDNQKGKRMDEPVDMIVTYTETDLVKLEFFQGAYRVLWIDLPRDKARDWASKIQNAAATYFTDRSHENVKRFD